VCGYLLVMSRRAGGGSGRLEVGLDATGLGWWDARLGRAEAGAAGSAVDGGRGRAKAGVAVGMGVGAGAGAGAGVESGAVESASALELVWLSWG
jgi:hypothetical protein